MTRKNWIVFFLFFLFLLGGFYITRSEIEKNVEANVVRFHVRANSNQKIDQTHKLAVRDTVVLFLRSKMKQAKNKEDALRILKKNKKEIYKIAKETLQKLDDKSRVTVKIVTEKFPRRDYGSYVFPKGTYDALRINIGEAKGHNFWCVMFPELCITREGEIITEKEARKELKKQVGMISEYLLRKK